MPTVDALVRGDRLMTSLRRRRVRRIAVGLTALASVCLPGSPAVLAQGARPAAPDPGLPPEYQGAVQYDEETRRQIEATRLQMEAWERAKRLNTGRGPGIDQLLNCEHVLRATSGAPWLVDRAKQECAEERRRQESQPPAPEIQASVDGCWAPFDQALTALEAAKDLFAQARRASTPQQGQLVQQGQARQREAKAALGDGRQCIERLVKQAIEIGGQLMQQMVAQMDRSRASGQAAGGAARPGPAIFGPAERGASGSRGTGSGTPDQTPPVLQGAVQAAELANRAMRGDLMPPGLVGGPTTPEELRGILTALIECPGEILAAIPGGIAAAYNELYTIGTYIGAANHQGLADHLYGGSAEAARQLAASFQKRASLIVAPHSFERGYGWGQEYCDLLPLLLHLRAARIPSRVATPTTPPRPRGSGSPSRPPPAAESPDFPATQPAPGSPGTVPSRAGIPVQYSGQVMRVPGLGEIRLGAPIPGAVGQFGAMYAVEGNPNYLVKVIIKEDMEGAQSVGRQLAGQHHLQGNLAAGDPGIPAPRIVHGTVRGPAGRPALVVENLKGPRWAARGAKLGLRRSELTRAHLDAIRTLYDDLGRRGLVWIDGHLGNIFFFEEGGVLRAGVVDHDLIFPIDKLAGLNHALKFRTMYDAAFLHNQAAKDALDAIVNGRATPNPQLARDLMHVKFESLGFARKAEQLSGTPSGR
jgi:hypothetical protein